MFSSLLVQTGAAKTQTLNLRMMSQVLQSQAIYPMQLFLIGKRRKGKCCWY